VRLADRELLLTADSCYMRKVLEEMILPPFAHDFDSMRRVIERFRSMERSGVQLIFGHDPAQWKGEGTLTANLQ
jgi:glyoxylase-like metal-dependent hydrolase (beta-lactamase superfamily II)